MVWSLLLQADSEGPTLIFRVVTSKTYLLSWHTVSRKSWTVRSQALKKRRQVLIDRRYLDFANRHPEPFYIRDESSEDTTLFSNRNGLDMFHVVSQDIAKV